MELLRFSKFKLQLLALISETRELRERERSTREELRLSIQKQKDMEAEVGRKFQEMQAELKSRDESQTKLESKIKFLENDNVLLEKKQKELKETIDSLLQSRETFINIYEDSTCALQNSIQLKDRKLAVISEKIHAHMLLFDSIEKEAAAVKQLVDYIQQLVIEKEQVVAGLKMKMDKIATYEKEFIEKIRLLENNVGNYQHELQAKDTTVSELKEQLEAAKFNKWQPQIDELFKTVGMKDKTIQNLTSEKQELHLEIQSLELILQRILNENSLLLAKENREDSGISGEDQRLGSLTQAFRKDSPSENYIKASVPHQDYKRGNDPSGDKYVLNSHLSESVSSSGPQSAVYVLDIPIDGKKRFDSESSTTETEAEALEAAPA